MASDSSSGWETNLLFTLPPELRNVIYSMVITTDFYELDPTISAKTFPRPRYGIFDIQRGIKAQGGTPSIARTCREIRTEALDVYYGKNTFALVGNDPGRAKTASSLVNRTAAHEWMQLIGEDAKYLRKVRFSVEATDKNRKWTINYLVSVMPNWDGDAPTVTVIPGVRVQPKPYDSIATFASHLDNVIQRLLARTGDMGEVWRAVIERALYPADFGGKFDFTISEEGLAEARAKVSLKQPRAAPKKSA